MTTTQYIGPRIIPVFDAEVEWDIDKPYEHLTMVQHNGETYMTRQYVPIGIQLPDSSQDEEYNDYWVHMSNWNAQVESYRQEVLQYNGRISTLENDLPIADFDAENTVKDYVDSLGALLPKNSFDSTNTVASAISSEETSRKAQDDIRAIDFATVSDMASSDDIKEGMIVHTLGFHSIGDGGAAYYQISDTGTANGMDVIACGYLFATLITETEYNVKQFGAYGDNTHDDSDIINYVISITPIHGVVYFPLAKYKVTKTIDVEKPIVIKGAYTGYDLEEYNDDYTTAQFQECLVYTNAKIGMRIAAPGIEVRNFSMNSSNSNGDSIVVKISSEGTGSLYEPAMRSLVFDNCQFIGMDANKIISAECSMIVSSFNVVRTIGGNYGFYIGYSSSVSTSLTFTSCYALGASICGYHLYNLSYCNFVSCASDGFTSPGITPQTRAYQVDHSHNVSFLSCGGEVSTEETMYVVSSNNILVELASSYAGKSYGAIYLHYSDNITLMNCTNDTFTNASGEISLKSLYSSCYAINCKNMSKASVQNSAYNLGNTFRIDSTTTTPGNLTATSDAYVHLAYFSYAGLQRYFNMQFTAQGVRPVLQFDNWVGGEVYFPIGGTLGKVDENGQITFLNDLALQAYAVSIPVQ